jgi:hypothetical protein
MATPDVPGIPRRFKVTEIQRQVPRTEPPSMPPSEPPPHKSPYPGHVRGGAPEPAVVVQGHGWKLTAPVAILVGVLTSIGGLFAGRQTAPSVDQSQAILELKLETRADIADIKRSLDAFQKQLQDRDNAMSNRLNVIERKIERIAP